MKKILLVIGFIIISSFIYFNHKINNYHKDSLIAVIDNNLVNNKDDILKGIYNSLNNNLDSYTYHCNYDNCTKDTIEILNDKDTLSIINNSVNPYYSYQDISIKSNKKDEFTIVFNKLYSEDDILIIDYMIDEILKRIINDKMSNEEKLAVTHNYIINTTSYGNNSNNYNKANGVLFEGIAICLGYSDTFSLFMNKLGIKNTKIVNDKHVWNAVYLNNKWYHIDVTFDDLKDRVGYEYFLIDSDTLNSYNDNSHYFNSNYYKEI